ncbi:uncharacterized protein LOC125077985 [Vanessa atalanta]|uniref:uncharacterized protein LOC125077985 n=1 Tax=Vanessa atalanta TaxID=42275 RepID=UPI001FCCC5F3|nr:uncharacterized protein LOC125077985 [Vanessa atalanta]
MESEEPPDGGGCDSISHDCVMSSDSIIREDSKKVLKAAKRSQTAAESILNKRDASSPPSASIQHTFTLPEFSGTKLKYNDSDQGPFIVHASRVEPDPSAGYTINLLKFAQIIYRSKVSGVLKGGIKSAGRNRVVVEFENASSANNFIDSPLFQEHNYKIIIPAFHITRMGIVKQIPIDWSMEEFLSSIECYTPGCRAIKARRLNRKSVTDDRATGHLAERKSAVLSNHVYFSTLTLAELSTY